MKKVFAIVLFAVCLLSFSLNSFATPSDANKYSGTLPLYINSQADSYGFAPTSITLVDLWGQTTTVAGTVDIEKAWAKTGYAVLTWELDIPFYFDLYYGNSEDDLTDGFFSMYFEPSLSLSKWSSGSNISYFDQSYNFLDCNLTLTSGSYSCPVRAFSNYHYGWNVLPRGNYNTYFGGSIRLFYSVTVAGPNRAALSASSLGAAVSQIKLFVDSNAGTSSANSRVVYQIYGYSLESYYQGLLDSQNSYNESLTDKEIAVNESIADQQASQASQEHEEVINGYDNSSGEDANSSLESGLASYEDQESQAHADFDQKMDDFDTPDISSISAGVTFLSSAITMWWDGLGIFQIGLLVMFALMIFNFISRYRGG